MSCHSLKWLWPVGAKGLHCSVQGCEFFWASSSITEKLFQTESSQRETAVLTESAAKVRCFPGAGGGGGGEWREHASQPHPHQGTLGADGHGTEAPGDTVVQEDSQETPVATSLGPDTQDLESEIHPQNLPSSPRAGQGLSCLPLPTF